jgi:hypothetical protein
VPTSPACRRQLAETPTCRRLSLADVEEAVRRVRAVAGAAGADLLVLNVDFLELGAAEAARRAADRDGTPFLDLVERFRSLRVAEARNRSRELGLSPPGDDVGGLLGGETVRLRVLAKTVEGPVRVRAAGWTRATFPFDEPMVDDGTHGDEVARDGVFSLTLHAPSNVSELAYVYSSGEAREFEPLPPFEMLAHHLVRLPAERNGPVDVFAELPRMAESVHPDAAGHATIAADLELAVERSPSLRRFVDHSSGGGRGAKR